VPKEFDGEILQEPADAGDDEEGTKCSFSLPAKWPGLNIIFIRIKVRPGSWGGPGAQWSLRILDVG